MKRIVTIGQWKNASRLQEEGVQPLWNESRAGEGGAVHDFDSQQAPKNACKIPFRYQPKSRRRSTKRGAARGCCLKDAFRAFRREESLPDQCIGDRLALWRARENALWATVCCVLQGAVSFQKEGREVSMDTERTWPAVPMA